ncbi:MAG: cytochrome c biogenesis protein ResB [Lachnospiraceae bacterium]
MKNNKIYRFLTSIRLAIALLIAIAILCILCTFIPQNQSETVYVQKYGEFMAAFIQRLGFDNILNSFWMYIVGMIFAINLSLCTWKRFQWAGAVSRTKFRIDAWGSPILHVGLCVILVGAVLSVSLGHQIYYEIPVGKTANVSGRSGTFELTVDDFEVEYYEDEVTPRQYISDITLKGKGGDSKSMTVEVNDPGKYDGITIIQQSYGWQTTITLSSQTASKQVQVMDDEWITLFKDGDETVSLGIAFYPDYAQVDGMAQLVSNRDNNPHILWVVSRGETPVASDVLALGESGTIFETLEITFDEYDYYTGLQIKYDPGIPVIFGGFFLACTGLVIRYAFGKKAEQKKENT